MKRHVDDNRIGRHGTDLFTQVKPYGKKYTCYDSIVKTFTKYSNRYGTKNAESTGYEFMKAVFDSMKILVITWNEFPHFLKSDFFNAKFIKGSVLCGYEYTVSF